MGLLNDHTIYPISFARTPEAGISRFQYSIAALHIFKVVSDSIRSVAARLRLSLPCATAIAKPSAEETTGAPDVVYSEAVVSPLGISPSKATVGAPKEHIRLS